MRYDPKITATETRLHKPEMYSHFKQNEFIFWAYRKRLEQTSTEKK